MPFTLFAKRRTVLLLSEEIGKQYGAALTARCGGRTICITFVIAFHLLLLVTPLPEQTAKWLLRGDANCFIDQ